MQKAGREPLTVKDLTSVASFVVSLLALTILANERSADESKKAAIARNGKKEPLTVKDWVAVASLVVSFLAVTLAALTGYYNILRKADLISVILDGSPDVSFDKDREQLVLRGSATITFINSGNRSAALRGVSAIMRQPHGAVPIDSCKDELTVVATEPDEAQVAEAGRAKRSFGYNLEPFVIEPTRILMKNLALNAPKAAAVPEQRADLTQVNKSSDTVRALVCLSFEIAVPDGPVRFKERPLFLLEVPKKNPDERKWVFEENYLSEFKVEVILQSQSLPFGRPEE